MEDDIWLTSLFSFIPNAHYPDDSQVNKFSTEHRRCIQGVTAIGRGSVWEVSAALTFSLAWASGAEAPRVRGGDVHGDLKGSEKMVL